jgi:FMN-dependent NADH-azoreductase
LAYIGIGELHSIAVEYDEFGDERLAASIAAAETEIASLVKRMASEIA